MIRPATVQDLPQLTTMLVAFANASMLDYKSWSKADLGRAQATLLDLVKHHYIMVAVKDDKLVGMIGAMKEQDPWIASRSRLRELFWWVEPDFRRSRLSAELYLKWEADCARFLKDKLVDQVSLSTQPGSSDIDLSRKGWRCVECHWIKD